MKKSDIKKFFKGTSFCLFWLFVGILIGIFVLSYVQGWFNQLINDLSFATGMMAIGTFFLAFITYWNIHSRNAQEQRDRKERYLNEIIGWLREIEDNVFASTDWDLFEELQENRDLVTKLGVTEEDISRNRRLRINVTDLGLLRRERRNAQYFEKVALKLDSDFSELINNILCLFEQRRELIMKSATFPVDSKEIIMKEIKTGAPELIAELIKDNTKPLDGLKLSENNINGILLGRNAGHIKDSISKAIDKAIEIKTAL